MENTPSVAISTVRAPFCRAALSWVSRSSRSAFLKRYFFALVRRTPSMIEAWFSESETMASSSPSSGSNTPPLASKQAA